MAGILIRMKLAVIRHSLKNQERAFRLYLGACLGLLVAAGTIWLTTSPPETLFTQGEILALVFGLWVIGWAFGPTFYGGEDNSLIPEHFRFLPVSRRKLASGLLAASAVGVPAAVTLVAFSALSVYAVPLGVVPLLVSIVAIVLQLAFVIVLCRIVTSLFRRVSHSQFGILVSSLLIGAMQAFFVTGWFVLVGAFLAEGFTPTVSALLYALPSGWGVFAVEAAHSGEWLHAASALAGLALLTLVLLPVWANILQRRLTTKRAHGKPARATAATAITPQHTSSPTTAVVRKEFKTWTRDYTRIGGVYFALAYAAFLGLYPLFAGVNDALPWIGTLFVISVVGAASNLYGYEGSGLWTTLTTPNSIRPDVRGRQIAWLLVVAPIAITVTLLCILLTGLFWTLPMALALLAATLGGGAGLLVAGSVYWLVPTIDPHKASDEMLDKGSDVGKFIVLLIATALLAAPAFGVVLLGMVHDMTWLQWAGVAAGIGTGVLWAWLFGALAYLRLEERGPELLNFMLKGTAVIPETAKLPKKVARKLKVYSVLGAIFLVPQALLPLIFTLQGEDTRVWFLPMYLEPGTGRIWAMSLFATLGVTLLALAALTYWRHRAAKTQKAR